MTAVYLVTYLSGYELWQRSLPVIHITSGRLFEIIMHSMLQTQICYSVFLADRTATQYNWLLASLCCPSIHLSVGLSVCL